MERLAQIMNMAQALEASYLPPAFPVISLVSTFWRMKPASNKVRYGLPSHVPR